MSESRIASPYAKSIIELAQSQQVLEQVKADMENFSQTVRSSRELALMLRNPIINNFKKESAIKAIFSAHFHTLTIRFFELVIRKNRSYILQETAAEFLKLYNSLMGIQVATLVTAAEISDNLKGRFLEIVKKISQKPRVELIHRIDPAIIGGFILKVGDRQIDDSITSQLRKLRTELIGTNNLV